MTRKGSQIPLVVARIAVLPAKPKVASVVAVVDVAVAETLLVLAKCTALSVRHVAKPAKCLSNQVAKSQFTVQIVSRDNAITAHVVTHAGN
jgi:hypothetical protein